MASSPPGGHPCPRSLRETISDALMLLAAASRSNKETALPSKDGFSRHRYSIIPFDDFGIVEKMKNSFTTYRFRVCAKDNMDARHYSEIKAPQTISTVEASPLDYLPFRMSWLEPRPAPKPPQRRTDRRLGRAPSKGRSKSCGPLTARPLHAPPNAGRNEDQSPNLSHAGNRKLSKRPPLPPPPIVPKTAPERPSTRPHPLSVASKRPLSTFRPPLSRPGNTIPIPKKYPHPEKAVHPGIPLRPDTTKAETERSRGAPSSSEPAGDGDLSERSWLWLDVTPVGSPVTSSFAEGTLPKASSALLSLPKALLLQISSHLSPSSAAALSRTHPALRHLTTSAHHLLSVLPRSWHHSIEETVTKLNDLIAANASSYISVESLPFLTPALQELYAFTHLFTPSSPISAQKHHFRSRHLSPQLLKAVLESFQAVGALLAPLTSPGSLPLALAAGAVKDLGSSRRSEMEEALEEWGLHAQSCCLFKLVVVMAEPDEGKRWERVKEQRLGKWERGKLVDGKGYLKTAVRALLVEERRT